MRGTTKVAIVLLGVMPSLQACQIFGSGPPPRHFASQTNPSCARLQPLVTAEDGSLTRDQLNVALEAMFKQADTDGSGALSMTEVAPINDELRKQNVSASPVMDWNGDGRINYQEFAGGWKSMFDFCVHQGRGDVVEKTDMARSPNLAGPPPAPKPPSGSSSGGK